MWTSGGRVTSFYRRYRKRTDSAFHTDPQLIITPYSRQQPATRCLGAAANRAGAPDEQSRSRHLDAWSHRRTAACHPSPDRLDESSACPSLKRQLFTPRQTSVGAKHAGGLEINAQEVVRTTRASLSSFETLHRV